jgi:uncharacterized LabA/DUF88 family protein
VKIAILIDGSFFLNRARHIWGNMTPKEMADTMIKYCMAHVEQEGQEAVLYRIFYYDCPPADINAMNPVTKEHFHSKHTPQAKWRLAFFEELKKKRKLALRFGKLDELNPIWKLSGQKLKDLCNGRITVSDLKENDVTLDIRQKGVDMKIGLDISSISFKKQVDQIVLIAGDSDFVPAAKMARREGIDFILDPMWLKIKDDLFEHIDGLRSQVDNPKKSENKGVIKIHKRIYHKKREPQIDNG